jgi:hypothetical protein
MCNSGPIHRDAECSGKAGKQLTLPSFKILKMSNIDQRIVVPSRPTTAITTPESRFVMNEGDLKGGLTVGALIERRTTPTRLCFGRASRRRRLPICRSQRATEQDSVRVFASFLDSALDSQPFLSPLAELSGIFLCVCGARRGVEGTFRLAAFGHGRCGRREKSGRPPLLKLSLKVKRYNTHNQNSAFVDAPV